MTWIDTGLDYINKGISTYNNVASAFAGSAGPAMPGPQPVNGQPLESQPYGGLNPDVYNAIKNGTTYTTGIGIVINPTPDMTASQSQIQVQQATAAQSDSTQSKSVWDYLKKIAGNILSGGTQAAQGAVQGAVSGSGQVTSAGQIGLAGTASPLLWLGAGALAIIVIRKVA